jgi:hypothetical protein
MIKRIKRVALPGAAFALIGAGGLIMALGSAGAAGAASCNPGLCTNMSVTVPGTTSLVDNTASLTFAQPATLPADLTSSVSLTASTNNPTGYSTQVAGVSGPGAGVGFNAPGISNSIGFTNLQIQGNAAAGFKTFDPTGVVNPPIDTSTGPQAGQALTDQLKLHIDATVSPGTYLAALAYTITANS